MLIAMRLGLICLTLTGFLGMTAVAAETTSSATASPTAVVEPEPEITCEAGCEKYNAGSLTCMNNYQYECGKQGWQKTGHDEPCKPLTPPPAK